MLNKIDVSDEQQFVHKAEQHLLPKMRGKTMTTIAQLIERVGEKRGIEQGLEQGIEQGIEQGLEKGRAEALKEMARKMLGKHVPVPMISEITGLSVEVIESLGQEAQVS